MNLVEFARPNRNDRIDDAALYHPEYAPNPPPGSVIDLQDLRDQREAHREALNLQRASGIAIFWIAEAQDAQLLNTEPDLQLVYQRAGEAGLIEPEEEIPHMKVMLAKLALQFETCEPDTPEHDALKSLVNYNPAPYNPGTVIHDSRLAGGDTALLVA